MICAHSSRRALVMLVGEARHAVSIPIPIPEVLTGAKVRTVCRTLIQVYNAQGLFICWSWFGVPVKGNLLKLQGTKTSNTIVCFQHFHPNYIRWVASRSCRALKMWHLISNTCSVYLFLLSPCSNFEACNCNTSSMKTWFVNEVEDLECPAQIHVFDPTVHEHHQTFCLILIMFYWLKEHKSFSYAPKSSYPSQKSGGHYNRKEAQHLQHVGVTWCVHKLLRLCCIYFIIRSSFTRNTVSSRPLGGQLNNTTIRRGRRRRRWENGNLHL